MNRRSLLGGVCGWVAAGVAGCLDAVDLGGESTASAGGDPPDSGEQDAPTETGTHDLFVENFDDEVYDVTLTVVRPSDGGTVWQGDYEAPDERGFSIPDLLVDGRTYEIALDVDDGPEASDTRSIEGCGAPNGGSRNVGVWIEDGAITFEQDNCDEIRVGAKLNYGDHESFLVDDRS